MDPGERLTNKARFKVLLSEEELQIPAVDDLCNKYHDWLRLCKESGGGRKTRSANKRADTVYEEIMAFKLPPIKIKTTAAISPHEMKAIIVNGNTNHSAKSSMDGDSSGSSSVNSSGHTGRTLRPRCRTPSVTRQQTASPSTPSHQNIRAHMKKQPDPSSANSNSSNVLSAALNQQHPSVSVTKLRQLLRADSAQKKREEEKERQQIVMMQRKVKEERAEAQKKQMLEERAITAKLNREKRLLHAAEVRKARERTKIEQKLREEPVKKPTAQTRINDTLDESVKVVEVIPKSQPAPTKQKASTKQKIQNTELIPKKKESEVEKVKNVPVVPQKPLDKPSAAAPPCGNLNETYQKPTEELDNIDISVCDETTDEQKKKPTPIASWAKAPGLRDVVVAQYSRPEEELLEEALRIFKGVKLPVDLDEIFGPNHSVGNRYICRTSSAVWTTPHKPALKRTSSDVLTPPNPKRHA